MLQRLIIFRFNTTKKVQIWCDMIGYLNIKNYIIIEQLEIAFSDGFNVITGETGAGKSIILGALKLLLGAKASPDLIKKGCEKSDIQAIFHLQEKERDKLNELFALELEDEVVISRELFPNRSVCKLNGDLITRSKLKEIAEYLIHIHGQNDNLELINENAQREILDDYVFVKDRSLLEEVKALYREYSRLLKCKEDENFNFEELQKKIEFIEFQMNEIDEIRPTKEDEEVEAEFEKLKNAVDIGYALQEVCERISNDDGGMLQDLKIISSKLGSVEQYYDVAADLTQIDEFYYELKDKLQTYKGMLDDLEAQSADFMSVEQRYDEINSLKKKYGRSIDEILQYRETLEFQKEQLTEHVELAQNIDAEIEKKREEYLEKAQELSAIRGEKALLLQKEIEYAMKDLNFDNAQFEIKISPKNMSENGLDSVSFMASLNAGMALAPIKNVASGGEISRIMLAVQSVTIGSESRPTIIFDEIDSGISGRSASAVAKRMHRVSRENQVLAITHLAQVALYADEHFLIDKKVIDGSSKSTLTRLSEEERLQELARIMGGELANEETVKNAKELREKVLVELQSL